MIYGLLKQSKSSQKSSKRILNVKSSGDKISENFNETKKSDELTTAQPRNDLPRK